MKFFGTKEQRKEHRKELFRKYFGYGCFALILSVICVGIFFFLPEDSKINSKVVLFKNNRQTVTENEILQASLVNPADYHAAAIHHHREDKGLELYRKASTRQSVIWFYNQITGNQDVSLAILENADKNNIPVSLAFALAWAESYYKVYACNNNPNLTVDRGLFQLNSMAFPNLEEKDFFNPYTSAKYGLSHLRYCLNVAGNEISALAMYNAGTTKVRNNKTPRATLDYVSKIMNYRDGLERLFETHVEVTKSTHDIFVASLPRKIS